MASRLLAAPSRRSLAVLIGLLCLVATGCQVKLAAGVDVGRDGSGRVTAGLGLDAEALAEVGDPATALHVDDLRHAGWDVQGPRKEGDGLTWVRASKPFTDPLQAAAVMGELSGPGGPFRDFRLVRTRSLLRSRTTFTGVVDLIAGLPGLSDPDLTARLGDVDLALDVDGLRNRFGGDASKAVQVLVDVGLPGKVRTNATAHHGDHAEWAPELGQSVQLRASSEAFRIDPAIPAAGAAGVAGVVLLIGSVTVVRRRRRRLRLRRLRHLRGLRRRRRRWRV